jgi:hypothetical protein
MMISDDEVDRVSEYLQRGGAYSVTSRGSRALPDQEFLDSVVSFVCSLPDVREERVEEARRRMAAAMPDSHEVASKMIGRALSDRVR